MLTNSIDVQDHTIDDQVREAAHIDFAQNTIQKVYVMFSDPQAGLKAMTASHFSRQHSWMEIEKNETEISIKIGLTSKSIERAQFPLAPARASTVQRSKA